MKKKTKQIINVLSTTALISSLVFPFFPSTAKAESVTQEKLKFSSPITVHESIVYSINEKGDVIARQLFTGKAYSAEAPYFNEPMKVEGISHAKMVKGRFAVDKDGVLYQIGKNFIKKNDSFSLGYVDQLWYTKVKDEEGKDIDEVVDVDEGFYHAILTNKQGEVYTWATSHDAPLDALGHEKRYFSPKKVEGLSGVVDVEANSGYSLALTSEGDVYCWGLNGGQPEKLTIDNIILMDEKYFVSKDGSIYEFVVNEKYDNREGKYVYSYEINKIADVPNLVGIDGNMDLVWTEDREVYTWIHFKEKNYTKNLVKVGEGIFAAGEDSLDYYYIGKKIAVVANDKGELYAKFLTDRDSWEYQHHDYSFESSSLGLLGLQVDLNFFEHQLNEIVVVPSERVWTNKDVSIKILYPRSAKVKEYRVDGAGWKPYKEPFVVNKNSTIEVRTDSETKVYRVNNIDKVKPTLQVTVPKEKARIVEVFVSATDNESGIREVHYKKGNASSKSKEYVVQNGKISIEENGRYTVIARDIAGNETVREINISNVDKTAPLAPSIFGTKLSKGTNIYISYPLDAKRKLFRLNDGEWQVYSGSFYVQEGIVEAKAIDEAGNESKIARYDVANGQKLIQSNGEEEVEKGQTYSQGLISVGMNYVLAIGDDGYIYGWGSRSKFDPSFNEKVKNGEIEDWWTGEGESYAETPIKLPYRAKQVAAMWYGFFFIDEKNDLYYFRELDTTPIFLAHDVDAVFGEDASQAYFIQDGNVYDLFLEEYKEPQKDENGNYYFDLAEDLDERIVQVVSVGHPKAYYLTENGDVYTRLFDWEKEKNSQEKIEGLQDVIKITRTSGFSFFALTKQGEVYYVDEKWDGTFSIKKLDVNNIVDIEQNCFLDKEGKLYIAGLYERSTEYVAIDLSPYINEKFEKLGPPGFVIGESGKLYSYVKSGRDDLTYDSGHVIAEDIYGEKIYKPKAILNLVTSIFTNMSLEAKQAKVALERAKKYTVAPIVQSAYKSFVRVSKQDAHYKELENDWIYVKEKYDNMILNESQDRKIRQATTLVKVLEKQYSSYNHKQAQDAVSALPAGDDKELLQARIDQVVQAQEVAKLQKQVEDATKAVERAESTKVKADIDRATQLVSALPDGEVKQTLLSRLDALKQATDPAITKAMEAIDLAKKYPTVSYYYKRAVELINQVQDETKRQELMTLLNTK